jgi:glycosyltransferase involved in cell wall biosynthesis
LKNQLNRVLFLPKWYPHEFDPFDGNFVQNHAEAINKRIAIDVIFAHSEKKSKNEYRVENTIHKGINEVRVFFKKSNSPLFILNPFINLYRYFKAQYIGYKAIYNSTQADLVHIHVLARTSLFALYLKFFKKIPYVITEHWSGYLKESLAYQGFFKELSHQIAVRFSSGVHTVSNNLAKAMQSHRLYQQYTTIYNVVDESIFKPTERANSNCINALYVGNLLQHPKRILDSIRVFKILINKGIDIQLNIYGEGDDQAECKKLIKELKMEDRIHLKGTLNRKGIAEVMAKADFLFLNSEFENQPCVINEALCCGTPVVVPNIEGIVEVMQDFCGIIFPRLDSVSFESALEEMINELDKYDRNKIRDYAVQNFGEEAIAEQFYQWYNKSLNN